MAEAKGFGYYRNHTTTELWAMLAAGDAWSVEQAGGVWRTARQGLEAARGSFKTHVDDLGQQWRGPASEEFQSRTYLVHDYSVVVESRMKLAEDQHFPLMVAALQGAQARAQGENALGESLHPDNDIDDPDDWMQEVKKLTYEQIAALDPQTRSTYTTEHANWRQARHDELAQTVADLGKQYSDMANERFAEPAAPPPEGMPGNSTYQQPTTGVFAPTTVNTDTATIGAGGSGAQPEAPVFEDDDDVASPWEMPSYTDIDEPSGGLASGGTATPTVPGGGPTVTGGGGSLPTGGGGLFGPGRTGPGTGGVPGRGTGGTPGRNPASTGPVRGSQPASRGGQPGAGRGTQPGTPGRGTSGRGATTGRGGAQQPQPGRSNSTSGRGTGNGTGRNGPGTTGRGTGTRAGVGVGKNGSPGANAKRRTDEVEEEEALARETKYVQAEDIFTAPFDPAVGPAHEGAKHQRAWNKEYDAWKRRQDEEDGGQDRA